MRYRPFCLARKHKMIPVSIVGTPMKFSIDEKFASLEQTKTEDLLYAPGHVVQHPSIGPLRCEEMDISSEDIRKIQSIRCSIMDHKAKQ